MEPVLVDSAFPDPPYPGIPPFFPESIPTFLRERDQWVCWRWNLLRPKDKPPVWKKGPCTAAGHNMGIVDLANHTTLAAAMEAVGKNDVVGVGFSITGKEPLVCIDLDHAINEEGWLSPEAGDIVGLVASYTEVSPSGKGIHVWTVAMKPGEKCRKGNFEMYGEKRFLCVTGQHFENTPFDVVPAQSAIDILYAKYLPETKKTAKIHEIGPVQALDISDEELLARMLRAKNKDKIRRLMDGDTSLHDGNESVADFALCCILAHWTRKDPARMDRMFRTSKLFRDKWDESRTGGTYGSVTIQKAINETPDVYEPNRAVVPTKTEEKDARPQIIVSTDEHTTIDSAIMALKRDGSVYNRGRQLVSVGYQNGSDGKIDRQGGLTIVLLPSSTVRERLNRCGKIVEWRAGKGGDGDFKAVHCPPWLAVGIHARGEWDGVPFLKGVVNHPVLVPGGRILSRAGYDPVTGLLVHTNDHLTVPEAPTSEELCQALDDLLEVVEDFNFPEPRELHCSAWLAGLLTLFARPAIAGPCPLFLADKSIRGAGGSKITDCIAEIALGRSLPRMTQVGEDDEQRKRITSILLAGDEAVLIDNVDTLGGAPLDALLTSESWRDRSLGKTEMTPEIPANTVWFATGNNVTVKGDTTRRVLPFRIEPVCENPEARTGFKFPDLLAEVRRRRSRLATAALTLLRGYVVAGSQDFDLIPWGSFEAWSAVIRNALVWMGLPDPHKTRDDLITIADRDRVQLSMFFDAIEAEVELSGLSFTAQKVARKSGKNEALHDALEEMGCVDRGNINTRLLGQHIKRAKGRIIEGRYIDVARESKNGNQWRLFKVKG